MELAKIRRHALSLWLRGVRLPLTVAERALAPREDPASWPPAIAFEKVEATIKEAVARATGDEVLHGMAHLQRTEIDKREEALAKRAEAETTRAEAREELSRAEADLDREREQAAARARRREEQIDRKERAARSAVARRATAKKATAKRAAAARAKAVDRAEATADAARLRKEQRALQAKAEAVGAEGEVLELDEAVRTSKAARQSS